MSYILLFDPTRTQRASRCGTGRVTTRGQLLLLAMCNSTGYRCHNLTKEQCDALSLATGVSDIVTATVSLSLLVCLLAIKKTNAWNTRIKRATIVFSVYLTISSSNVGAVMFYNGLVTVR